MKLNEILVPGYYLISTIKNMSGLGAFGKSIIQE